MPTEHSNIMGGSTAAQRINCPGSYQLEKQAPKKESSQYADRGSMLHAAMELLVVADPQDGDTLDSLMLDLQGQNLGYKGHEITNELIMTKLYPAWAAWRDVREKYDLDDWFIEQKVSLEVVIEGAFGTADILAKDKENRLHVLDWKFGDGIAVPVEGNYGAGFYAAAAMYDPDPELEEFCEDITGIVLHIVQPRAGFDEDPLQSWETDEEWIEALIDQAETSRDLAVSDDPPYKAGSWCTFCGGKALCPEHQRGAEMALSAQPKSMTAVDLGKYLLMADQLKGWIKSVYDLAQVEMEGGASVPGYKLVQKRATRKWTDEAEAEKRLKNAKVKIADSHDRKLRSPAQIEKLNPKRYKNRLADLVESKSSGVTVVPDTDKRPAVTNSVELLANALPEQPKDKQEK